ncbi:MAG: glycerol-3-phosphate dehydrogenase/oxidase [Planctomycetia bacterium]|nr:glycerol-3-phosphate dehydrogenase/oxidase [Planctomycetia bacterium]
MNRNEALRAIGDRSDPWDVLVIGGGATGLGAAVDAAARGYHTLLVEQHDFCKGTSSRSTKLIHGGIRYLAQGRVNLVQTALFERELLLRNAPHLVHDMAFVIPAYSLWELPFYFSGLKAYDLLAGKYRRAGAQWLSRRETLERCPTLIENNLRGGILYHDCQFDDARLAVALARTLVDLGGTAANYLRVAGLIKSDGIVCGALLHDVETGNEFDIRARVVINATGVFADDVRRMDEPAARRLMTPSQGIHAVLDRAALPGDCAVVVPHTDDSRVLFAIPWHGKVLLGTTDTPVSEAQLEPRPLGEEIDFLLANAGRYLRALPRRGEIVSLYAGLRPLVADPKSRSTAATSRDHHIEISASGLVTITGGKWTTYRHMGENVVDVAARAAGLPVRLCGTRELRLHGWRAELDPHEPLTVYGSEAPAIMKLAAGRAELGSLLHPRLPYLKAEVVWSARHEMARTPEDVLARRTRALFLDARASIEAAPVVAELMAGELGMGPEWVSRQVAAYGDVAAGYVA